MTLVSSLSISWVKRNRQARKANHPATKPQNFVVERIVIEPVLSIDRRQQDCEQLGEFLHLMTATGLVDVREEVIGLLPHTKKSSSFSGKMHVGPFFRFCFRRLVGQANAFSESRSIKSKAVHEWISK